MIISVFDFTVTLGENPYISGKSATSSEAEKLRSAGVARHVTPGGLDGAIVVPHRVLVLVLRSPRFPLYVSESEYM